MDAADPERMALDDPRLLADFHRMIAATLARQLGRTTALLADFELQASRAGWRKTAFSRAFVGFCTGAGGPAGVPEIPLDRVAALP